MLDILDTINPFKKNENEEVYLRCKSCGHKEIMNKEFVAKLAGIAITAFGCKAWIGFLFAGTGFAFAICVAIVIGGLGMLAYADEITKWVAEKYECPKCKAHRWELIPESTLLKEKEILRKKAEHEYDMRQKDLIHKIEIEKEKFKRLHTELMHKEKLEQEKIKYIEEKARMEAEHKKEMEALHEKYAAEISMLRKSMNDKIRELELGKINEILMLEKLKENFWHSLTTCKREIDIYVPFIGSTIKDRKFIDSVSFALSRGVKIKIRCGMDDGSSQSDNGNGSAKHIHKSMKELKTKLRGNKLANINNLTYKLDNAHCKLLIVDDEYYILSSMNFLSYKGEDIVNKYGEIMSEKWEELGEKSTCKENLKTYRDMFFNF